MTKNKNLQTCLSYKRTHTLTFASPRDWPRCQRYDTYLGYQDKGPKSSGIIFTRSRDMCGCLYLFSAKIQIIDLMQRPPSCGLGSTFRHGRGGGEGGINCPCNSPVRVSDPRGRQQAHARSIFFHFLQKNWQNNKLTHPLWDNADLPLVRIV